MSIMKVARKLWRDDSGQGMVEYGLIMALVAIVAILALTTLGSTIKAKFEAVNAGLTPP